MFCEIADFELLPYNIPNLADPMDENASDGTFEAYVDQVEEEILRELLGDVMYDQFVLALAGPTPDAWWTNLRDGASYQINGTGPTYVWKGLKWLLQPYVWFMWMRDNETKKTQEGASIAVAENAERVSLARELTMGYNDFAHRSGFAECTSNKNTLYGFLKSDPTNYVAWDSSEAEVEYINAWNI